MASNDILYFHSKSKSAEGKHLSNFTLVDGGLTFANFEGKWDSEETGEKLKGKVFPSIEHAFQGVKFAMSGGSDAQIDALIECLDIVQAKRMGGKKYFESNGMKLDIKKWSLYSKSFMRYLVRERMRSDDLYKTTVGKYLNRLYHFDRAGKRSNWGGYFSKATGVWEGPNMLSKIMEEEYRKMV